MGSDGSLAFPLSGPTRRSAACGTQIGPEDARAPGGAAVAVLSYWEASSLSAISSNFLTVFQFLPVPGVRSVFSRSATDSFGRAMPLGK